MSDIAELRQLLSATHRLPSLPQALLAVQQALQQQQLSLRRCVALIEQEPALAATTLRLANSAFYGAPGRVASVGDALRLLGLRTVASLLTAAAVQQLLLQAPQPAGDAPFDIRAAWQHALHSAVAARQMALLAGLDADQAMLAGLVHDIGQLTLATVLPEQARQARLYALQHQCSALQGELAVLGLGHPQVGALLARRWHLAPVTVSAISRHHQPAAAAGQPLLLAELVMHADALAHALVDQAGHADSADAPDTPAAARHGAEAGNRPVPGVLPGPGRSWPGALGMTDDAARRLARDIALQAAEMGALMAPAGPP